VARAISFDLGRTNDERVEHELFDDADAWRESDMKAYRQKAGAQLGTVGSGNHYVDLLRDEDGFVWIGVHFGSRGLGHTSATRYLKAAGGKDGMNVPPAVIDEDSELGRDRARGVVEDYASTPATQAENRGGRDCCNSAGAVRRERT
jgi:tRNA-splicing ligase RtcB